MKILEPGRPQKGWTKECVCTGKGNWNGGCGAKLLVEETDLYQTSSSARDETEYYTTFMCEACGVETDIEATPSVRVRLVPRSREWVEGKRREILGRK